MAVGMATGMGKGAQMGSEVFDPAEGDICTYARIHRGLTFVSRCRTISAFSWSNDTASMQTGRLCSPSTNTFHPLYSRPSRNSLTRHRDQLHIAGATAAITTTAATTTTTTSSSSSSSTPAPARPLSWAASRRCCCCVPLFFSRLPDVGGQQRIFYVTN